MLIDLMFEKSTLQPSMVLLQTREGLKYSSIIFINGIEKDATGKITKIIAKIDEDQVTKVKSFIHWIAEKEALVCETRLYGLLFTVHNPNEE
jgi:hypothetical protein